MCYILKVMVGPFRVFHGIMQDTHHLHRVWMVYNNGDKMKNYWIVFDNKDQEVVSEPFELDGPTVAIRDCEYNVTLIDVTVIKKLYSNKPDARAAVMEAVK